MHKYKVGDTVILKETGGAGEILELLPNQDGIPRYRVQFGESTAGTFIVWENAIGLAKTELERSLSLQTKEFILALLTELVFITPHERVGQLIYNITYPYADKIFDHRLGIKIPDIYELSDEEFAKALIGHCETRDGDEYKYLLEKYNIE